MWAGLVANSVYLDSNAVIFAIERGNRWQPALRDLFEAVEQRSVAAVTSEITLAEVLAKPLAERADDVIRQYESLFDEASPLVVVAIDRPIIRSAAALQGELDIKLVDAIHVATARRSECGFFLSNDLRLGRKLTRPRWLSMDWLVDGIPHG